MSQPISVQDTTSKLHRHSNAWDNASGFLLHRSQRIALLGDGSRRILDDARAQESILLLELAARHILEVDVPSQAPIPEEIVLVDAEVQLGKTGESLGVV